MGHPHAAGREARDLRVDRRTVQLSERHQHGRGGGGRAQQVLARGGARHGQGDCLVPRRHLARRAHGPRPAPPQDDLRPRLLGEGRRQDVQIARQLCGPGVPGGVRGDLRAGRHALLPARAGSHRRHRRQLQRAAPQRAVHERPGEHAGQLREPHHGDDQQVLQGRGRALRDGPRRGAGHFRGVRLPCARRRRHRRGAPEPRGLQPPGRRHRRHQTRAAGGCVHHCHRAVQAGKGRDPGRTAGGHPLPVHRGSAHRWGPAGANHANQNGRAGSRAGYQRR
mmetsp:Transcript_7272/g.14821  ORF Transcript_7272/g.14821 Transcript_7272/m.14821 type:complete len:280 (-) Transcript_7272:493-1332(-)